MAYQERIQPKPQRHRREARAEEDQTWEEIEASVKAAQQRRKRLGESTLQIIDEIDETLENL